MVKILSKKKIFSPGQILLVVLLIMAVILTIGLSIITRSIADIKMSRQTEEATRAFSAAEAGIEKALVAESGVSGQFPAIGSSYETKTLELGEGQTEFAFLDNYKVGEVQTLWLADHETLNQVYARDQLRVVWGTSGGAVNQNSPALEVIIYYLDGGNYKVAKFALDPYSSRSPDNSFCNPGEGGSQCGGISNFLTAGETVDTKSFHYGATLNLSSFNNPQVLLFARLRLLYSNSPHPLGARIPAGATGTGNFSSQGLKIESVGQAGSATRKVEVARLHSAPPSIFDFVLYSGSGLEK